MTKKTFNLIASILILGTAQAQTDSSNLRVLPYVLIADNLGISKSDIRNVKFWSQETLAESGGQTLSDELATLPGIYQLTTAAISKPVIRGQYGNRVQINAFGMRVEDQQWEDELGLGLSDAGVESVEIIKGPASVLYGSDAIGGVVRLVDEGFGEPGAFSQDLGFKFFSNTLGASLNYGFKKRTQHQGFLLRIGTENHGDYSDGAGDRIPNTRFGMYNLKAAYYSEKGLWTSENRASVSFNQFGFITDTLDLHDVDEEEGTLFDRSFNDDHQDVLLGMFSSRNTVHLGKNSQLQLLLGAQSNHRQEVERDGEAELDLWLNTGNMDARLQTQLHSGWSLNYGIAGFLQRNINYGERAQVPDARIQEASAYVLLRKKSNISGGNAFFEAGLRYDQRRIHSLLTAQLNPWDSEIPPFERNLGAFNGSLGESWVWEKLVIKANLGTAYRAGNLSELAANGLHEGSTNWYLGNPNLKTEQCLNTEVSAEWHFQQLRFSGAVFRNMFQNYIYLTPTSETRFGYPVYQYLQSDAVLQGFETGAGWSPGNLDLTADFSFLDASLTKRGTPLPFMPSNRLQVRGKYFILKEQKKGSNWSMAYLSLGINAVSAQHKITAFETATPAYTLLNAGTGIRYKTMRFSLQCRNLTNVLYADHLSRLRYLGVNDMGRSVVLQFNMEF